jgi:hypothetical protein
MPLNESGYADYLWPCYDGGQTQAERKQWTEILAGMDAVEDQLRRQIEAHPGVRTMLVVEGIALPGPGSTLLYRAVEAKGKRGRHLMICQTVYNTSLSMAYAWLYQISKHMEVYFTSDLTATCTALMAFCKADMKAEHTTFQRYFKKVDWHPNPQVQKLMCMAGGLGPRRAEALIAEFGTVWGVLKADPKDLQQVSSIGSALAVKILREAGRPDV